MAAGTGDTSASTNKVSATERLMNYWAHGEGAAKIRWGTHGDFDRCVRELTQHVPASINVKGLCSNLHVRALGVRPGQERGDNAIGRRS